jgi:hypothetical protein
VSSGNLFVPHNSPVGDLIDMFDSGAKAVGSPVDKVTLSGHMMCFGGSSAGDSKKKSDNMPKHKDTKHEEKATL